MLGDSKLGCLSQAFRTPPPKDDLMARNRTEKRRRSTPSSRKQQRNVAQIRSKGRSLSFHGRVKSVPWMWACLPRGGWMRARVKRSQGIPSFWDVWRKEPRRGARGGWLVAGGAFLAGGVCVCWRASFFLKKTGLSRPRFSVSLVFPLSRVHGGTDSGPNRGKGWWFFVNSRPSSISGNFFVCTRKKEKKDCKAGREG